MTRVRAAGWPVGTQFGLLAVLVLAPAGHVWRVPQSLQTAGNLLRWAGAVAIVMGANRLGRGASAHPAPTSRAVLRTDGPYRLLVRHPVYRGVVLLTAGIAATTASVVALIGFAAPIGLLHVKARFEERLLTQRLAGDAACASATPPFVPGLRRRLAALDNVAVRGGA